MGQVPWMPRVACSAGIAKGRLLGHTDKPEQVHEQERKRVLVGEDSASRAARTMTTERVRRVSSNSTVAPSAFAGNIMLAIDASALPNARLAPKSHSPAFTHESLWQILPSRIGLLGPGLISCRSHIPDLIF